MEEEKENAIKAFMRKTVLEARDKFDVELFVHPITEDTRTRSSCKCDSSFDMRCRCHSGNQSFFACPVRVETAYFAFTNNCDIMQRFESIKKVDRRLAFLKNWAIDLLQLTEKDANDIAALYLEDRENGECS